ncbi:methyltransferase domain-containing protein [Tautonia sociabilis]|uniref:Methyltransferase domain-containing protein n=1 Tax=Tautonia sociabilis TaxID=2080755 RepID=A0A432MRJ7_9BACT|nr:methyltransferase domain-containing protein [Tautonia sociabilis]RUL89596.1 methyltransferase domain-containing protein [Tautonia sociabilis]
MSPDGGRRPRLVPPRRSDPELMDAPGLPEAEVAEAYAVLRRVNRHLGNNLVIDREVARFLIEDRPESPVSVLDVGSGSGDIPRRIARRFESKGARAALAVALDRDPTASALSRSGTGAPMVVRADALRLPMPDRSVDLVSAVKFAHHFEGPALARLLSEMARVARRRVLVLDIRRHWAAYWGFVAWSRVFTRNRLVRHDGPLSVLRGFSPEELTALASLIAGFHWTVRRYPGFQIALVGRRSDTGASPRLAMESEQSTEHKQ